MQKLASLPQLLLKNKASLGPKAFRNTLMNNELMLNSRGLTFFTKDEKKALRQIIKKVKASTSCGDIEEEGDGRELSQAGRAEEVERLMERHGVKGHQKGLSEK
jgi:hypothetical protein